MHSEFCKIRCLRQMATILMVMILMNMLVSAQAQTDDRSESSSPLQRALQVARDLVEEEHGSPLTVVRWRFYEDNWSSQGSYQLYGSFGIDNCADAVPIVQKRGDILFGYTFTIRDVSGREYQARVGYNLVDSILCDEVFVPPAYGGPTSAAEAVEPEPESETDAPTPVVGAGHVEGFVLGGQANGFDPHTADRMRSAGMTWVKQQLPHHAGIATGSQWISDAHDKGFKILLSVAGDKNSLAPDRFDSYTDEYAAFLGQLAAAGADAIEVWNEPNLDHEWPTGHINGGRYTSMLAKAYNAIKGANGATLVISAAPAPTGAEGAFPGAVVNDDNFMRQMAQAGAAQYLDCLGLHYNEGVVSPTASSGDSTRNYYPTLYYSSMLERGAQFFPGKSICWTELGYLSDEGMPSQLSANPGQSNFFWARAANVTVAQQAQWLAQAAALSAGDSRVSMLIVWNVNYQGWGADPQGGYAIVRPDGTCPACGTLGTVMSGGG